MLFKQIHLRGISEGSISVAFRKWKRPSVKKGTLQKTVIGQIEILDISEINEQDISEGQAIAAGYSDLQELLQLLKKWKTGTIYKIDLKYHSPDPRIELRNQSEISDVEFQKIRDKLKQLDKYSNKGDWTLRVLTAIKRNPELRAVDLAAKMDLEKSWLKPNVRKLKGLGLTISHGVGYSLSPRGEVILERLIK